MIAPDLRGFGQQKSDDTVVTMDEFASDLHTLLRGMEIERVVLCGLSMGGYVAMAFTERWPEMVEALILCNTRSTADTEEGKAGRLRTATDALEKGMSVIARGMLPNVLSEHTRRTRPGSVRHVEAMMARQDPRAAAAASRGMALRPDRTGVLRAFEKPALVITGAEDTLMPLATSQAMVDALPKGQLIVLKQAGHLSNLEAADAFNNAVLDFLEGVRS